MRTDKFGRPLKIPTFRADRLRYWRLEAGLPQTAAAEAVGVTVGSYGAWERRAACPAPHRLTALADAMGCRIEDLLDTPQTLSDYRHQQGLRQRDLASRLGVSSAAVGAWESHRAGIPGAVAAEVADVLGVDAGQLASLGRVHKPWITSDPDGHVWVGDIVTADPFRVDLTARAGLSTTLLSLYEAGTANTAASLTERAGRVRQEIYSDVRQLEALGLITTTIIPNRAGAPLQLEMTPAGRQAVETLVGEGGHDGFVC